MKGPIAGSNPFAAKGLEWETTSPPPTFNFDTTPIVTEATHSYAHEEARVA
jgi:cytochrome c oxidase subunit 1